MTVPTRRATVLMAVCAAVALGIGVLLRPAPTALPRTGTGDAALAALGREVVGPVAAARAPLDAPPGTYSNMGFAVLGSALAAAVDRPSAQLITERVLTPLGMSGAAVVTTPDALGPRDLTGETTGGRRADPWAGEGIAPAGSVRADIADTSRLARALLVGDAPGIDALRPRADLGAPDRIGWAWLSRPDPVTGRAVVWHNGGTGGFTSFLGVDREAGVAVVVLSALGAPDDTTTAGFELLRRMGGAR